MVCGDKEADGMWWSKVLDVERRDRTTNKLDGP